MLLVEEDPEDVGLFRAPERPMTTMREATGQARTCRSLTCGRAYNGGNSELRRASGTEVMPNRVDFRPMCRERR